MKTRNLFSKLIAGVLAAIMLLSLVPVVASAEQSDLSAMAESNLDNLVLNKTVELQADGTYTITLEAYAKGQVSITSVQQVVPTDIILVLDQSGSMVTEMEQVHEGYTVTEMPTNAQLANTRNYYYYKVGDEYFRLTATQEITEKHSGYFDAAGNEYSADQVSDQWVGSNGKTYTAPDYVTSTLQTWTRQRPDNKYQYVNDADTSKAAEAGNNNNSAQRNLRNYVQDNISSAYTVEFEGGNRDGYVAASFLEVTYQENRKAHYVYSYTDGNGNVVVLGYSGDATWDNIDNETANLDASVYAQNTSTGTRKSALQHAAYEFVDMIQENAAYNGVDHRVAIVGFASDSYNGSNYDYYYANSELFIGATQYNYAAGGEDSTYNSNGNLASDHYHEALQSVNTSEGYNNLYASIGALDARGGTHPEIGFEMANGILEAAKDDTYTKPDGTQGKRPCVIIFLTDGQPGDSGFDNSVATSTKTAAQTSVTSYGATIYTIAVLDDEDLTNNMVTFLNDVTTGSVVDGDEYEFTLAQNASKLHDFFGHIEGVTEDYTTTVTLSENAFIVDRISEYFYIPDDFVCDPYLEKGSTTNVTIAYAPHLGHETFGDPVLLTKESGVTAHITYGQFDGKIHGVTVQDHKFLSEENMVTTSYDDEGDISCSGNKIVVTITGVLAKDEAASNTLIYTNHETSGVWDGTDETGYACVKPFPMPITLIERHMYVLDYAQEAELPVFDMGENQGTALRLDAYYTENGSAEENYIFNQVGAEDTAYKGTYGNAQIVAGELIYTPTTMKWDGYDTFYALGTAQHSGDTEPHYVWTKVSVMPANNVYYEDTFITTGTETETQNSTVGITYTGNWDEVLSENVNTNTETPDDGVQGWIGALEEETGDTDGSIHMADTKGSTATFSFTGTGFEVYSRTNMTSGKVLARVTWTEYRETDYDANGNGTIDDGEAMGDAYTRNYLLYVDTSSASGEYYQIPTLWFDGTEHREYTVTLIVQSDASEGSYSYCIDGIRIYNPLSPDVKNDPVVDEAYGDEVNAMFVNVRDMLLDQNSFADGVESVDGLVFIDKVTSEQAEEAESTDSGTPVEATNQIGLYEDYGPKNEVYIAPGHAIAFRVDTATGATFHVGLKSIEGESLTVKVSGGDVAKEIQLAHTGDMYYVVTPDANGYIVIENTSTSGGVLSVTNLKVLDPAANSEAVFSMRSSSVGEMLMAVDAFDVMAVAAYDAEPEAPSVSETPVEPELPAEPETPENQPNLDIEVPDETETEEDSQAAEQQEKIEAAKRFVSRLFSGFYKLFSNK